MQIEKIYSGIIIPAITPLTESFRLDEAAVETTFENFYQHEVHPFILGTTGESASLSLELKYDYLKAAVKYRKPGAVLYAGISSNCFEESVAFANDCFDAGVDAVAATLPSYYALSESQMKRYFEQLADAIKAPLIIYNIPATTHMSIPLQLIDELSYHPDIVATKDSERSEERLQQSWDLWRDRSDFGHFLGWAAKSADALLNGSDGLIPSTGNLYPKVYDDMFKAVAENDTVKTYELQRLSDALGNLYQSGKLLGESLRALKVLMQDAGLCQSFVMPPLQNLPDEIEKQLINDWRAMIEKEGLRSNKK
ncbi:MAG: dihydrodipicolinate synthase family protein [Chitinophagaceae bacterium]